MTGNGTPGILTFQQGVTALIVLILCFWLVDSGRMQEMRAIWSPSVHLAVISKTILTGLVAVDIVVIIRDFRRGRR